METVYCENCGQSMLLGTEIVFITGETARCVCSEGCRDEIRDAHQSMLADCASMRAGTYIGEEEF